MGMNDFTGGANGNNNNTPPTVPMGFTPSGSMQPQDTDNIIDDLLINYNDKYANGGNAMFREPLVRQLTSVLIGKNKPNALLVGSAGVGKTKIVEDLAYRIATDDPTIPDALKNCIVYELPLANIVADSSLVGQLEAKMLAVIEFAADPDNHAIIFIDEIHQMVDGSATYSKLAQILKPALARGDMRVIGATTTQESTDLMDDPAFNRRFSRIIVDELTQKQTEEVLLAAKPSYINHYKNRILIDDDILPLVVKIADQYATAGNHRPDTALTLLDRACADAIVARKIQEQKLSADPSMSQALSMLKTQLVPLTERGLKDCAYKLMTGCATKTPLDEQRLRDALSRIKGQDKILDEITNRMHKLEMNLFPRKTPFSMLFAGASGVGKTEVTKIIAQELTGTKPIMLNMAEYHSSASINRIIGSSVGYVGSDSKAELPFDSLESNPYQVILLDEFEKADKSVQRLFMSVFDEGTLQTSNGRTIDFSKTIIIATTNANHSAGKTQHMGFVTATSHGDKQRSALSDLKQWFDTELLNRFEKVYTFNNLDKDIYRDIVADIYKREISRIKSVNRSIKLPDELDDDTLDSIVDDTFVPEFGARPASKAVRDYIEDNA